MSQFTCQHCNFTAGDRKKFPNSEHVCISCVRDRPIAWKTILYILAKKNQQYPEPLKVKPEKRKKAIHPLQNLSNNKAKELANNIKFDTKLFVEWTNKKKQLQQEKNGQCAYSDACLDYMFDWITSEIELKNFYLHDSDIEQCSFTFDTNQGENSIECNSIHEIQTDGIISNDTTSSVSTDASETEHVVKNITNWRKRVFKLQEKNKKISKELDDVKEINGNLEARNRQLITTNETLRELIKHLTEQLISDKQAKLQESSQ